MQPILFIASTTGCHGNGMYTSTPVVCAGGTSLLNTDLHVL